MADLETDYLVVGAGVSGMGIVDTLSARADVDSLIVDTRHSPGGHWHDVYPFVSLHQPAASFGADSKPFKNDRIDTHGPNAGFYELATAPEVLTYYGELLHDFDARGNVRFLNSTQYLGADGGEHVLRSVVTGATTRVKVRRRLVDTTYAEPTIPSRHTPSFGVDADARLVAPNALVELGDVPDGFTILGAGKTAMDAVCWLIGQGVDPDTIRWVRPRDMWVLRRAATQPLRLIGTGYMKLQAGWVKAAALAESEPDLARQLEVEEVLARLDPSVEPTMFRGATVSDGEIETMRAVTDVVRAGRVLHVGRQALKLEQGEVATPANQVYVDCTASGVRDVPIRPVFEPGRITMQIVTLGNVPFSAATIGAVEALVDDDAAKNAMCAPLGGFGPAEAVVRSALAFLQSTPQRMFHPEVGPWMESCRVNSARVIPEMADDPDVVAGQATTMEYLGPAMENLARLHAGG